ncbi:MAG: hypothetical protein RLZZ252_1251 [Bacteroidota bacterium]|jgi:ABC-type multidrug transport system ATPase subunit
MKIIVENCGKSFHRNWLYRNINFTFEIPNLGESKNIALLGSNGSGKSTFGLMLLGQIAPTEGRIIWVNEEDKTMSTSAIIASSMLISPGLELPEELSLTEWYNLHNSLRGFNSGFTLTKLLELCSFPKATLTKSLATFSSGMKQRVKLVTGFFTPSSLLFLDEPLSNLDDRGIDLYAELVKDNSRNRLIIVASNRSDEYEFCDTAIKIQNGGIETTTLQ